MNGRLTAVRGTAVRAAHQVRVVEAEGDLLSLRGKRFHLIGVGGVGMSALARVLVRHGARVTGSDTRGGSVTETLAAEGIGVELGHRAAHVSEDTQVVVMSAAIRPENPELAVARARGLTIYKYAEMLGRVMARYRGIAVAGTHGKSTTTAWLSYVLRGAGVDASYVMGAASPQLGGSSAVGDSPYFVAEACEYDRSFLNLRPAVACLLNVEVDHLDYYRDEADIVEAFTEFALATEHGGRVVLNGDDPNCAAIRARLRPDLRVLSCGLAPERDVQAEDLVLVDGRYRFALTVEGQRLGPVHLSLAGRHNVTNALVVAAVARDLGLDGATIRRHLAGFTGIDRRLMFKAEVGGVTVLDDYAHHPTEVRCTLEAIRERYPGGRLWCVFQAHQHSRTRFLLDGFAESFKLADATWIPEIYAVRDPESVQRSICAETLVERLQSRGCEACFAEGSEAICRALAARAKPGDVVVTMGAGDVWKVSDAIVQRLRADR